MLKWDGKYVSFVIVSRGSVMRISCSVVREAKRGPLPGYKNYKDLPHCWANMARALETSASCACWRPVLTAPLDFDGMHNISIVEHIFPSRLCCSKHVKKSLESSPWGLLSACQYAQVSIYLKAALHLQPHRASSMAVCSQVLFPPRLSEWVYVKTVLMHSGLPPHYGLMFCFRTQKLCRLKSVTSAQ